MGIKKWMQYALVGAIMCAGFGCDDNETAHHTGDITMETTHFHKVEIDWRDGNVEIEQSTDNFLRAAEEGNIAKTDGLCYRVEEDTLHICDCKNARAHSRTQGKTLHVELPSNLALEIEGKNVEITMGILEMKTLSIETGSGNISVEKMQCAAAELETQSGGIYVGELHANTLDLETDSGEVKLGLSKPTRAEISTKTGDAHLFLLGETGARLHFKTNKGQLHSKRVFVKQDGYYDYAGKTTSRINVETKTGDLYIE